MKMICKECGEEFEAEDMTEHYCDDCLAAYDGDDEFNEDEE